MPDWSVEHKASTSTFRLQSLRTKDKAISQPYLCTQKDPLRLSDHTQSFAGLFNFKLCRMEILSRNLNDCQMSASFRFGFRCSMPAICSPRLLVALNLRKLPRIYGQMFSSKLFRWVVAIPKWHPSVHYGDFGSDSELQNLYRLETAL